MIFCQADARRDAAESRKRASAVFIWGDWRRTKLRLPRIYPGLTQIVSQSGICWPARRSLRSLKRRAKSGVSNEGGSLAGKRKSRTEKISLFGSIRNRFPGSTHLQNRVESGLNQ